jgi:hypothetical protein
MYQETAIVPLTLLVCAVEAGRRNVWSHNKPGAHNYAFKGMR